MLPKHCLGSSLSSNVKVLMKGIGSSVDYDMMRDRPSVNSIYTIVFIMFDITFECLGLLSLYTENRKRKISQGLFSAIYAQELSLTSMTVTLLYLA